MSPGKQREILFSTGFPIYALEVDTEGGIVVAGGGGSAKTGVPNVIVGSW